MGFRYGGGSADVDPLTVSLTILGFVLFIFGCILYYKYNGSRNKALFFRTGIYRSYPYVFGIMIVVPVLLSFVLPKGGIAGLDTWTLHAAWVENALKHATGLQKPLFEWLSYFTETHGLTLLMALIITVFWIYWLRRLDFFNTNPLWQYVLMLGVGMVASLATFYLSYLEHNVLGLEYSGEGSVLAFLYNLFVYCWVSIGIPQALTMVLVVMAVLRFVQVDEPLNILIKGCITGLGFALVENLGYSVDFEAHTLIANMFLSAVGQMFAATFVLYGLVLRRFHPTRTQWYWPLLYFLWGSFLHGIYDYLLFDGSVLLFLGFFFLVLHSWLILINNAINNSPHFSYGLYNTFEKVQHPLALIFSGFMALSFVLGALMMGTRLTLELYAYSLILTGLPSLLMIVRLSRFDLFRGYWREFHTPRRGGTDDGGEENDNMSELFVKNIINPINLVGQRIKLHAPAFNHTLTELFDVGEGYIEDRILTDHPSGAEDPNWFLVKVAPGFDVPEDEYQTDRILMKLRHRQASLVHDTHIECWLRFIPVGIDPRQERDYRQYTDYGIIMINGHDYVYEDN